MNKELLLEGIHDVNWASLSHAYGPADDAPGILAALLEEDTEKREEAWMDFHSFMTHQGSVYTATAPCTPFLVRWLQHPEVPEQRSIWAHLNYLASMTREIQEPEYEGEREAPELLRDIRASVLKEIPVFMRLAREGNDEARLLAYAVLGELPEEEAQIYALLEEEFQAESSPDLKAKAIYAQGQLVRSTNGQESPLASSFVQKALALIADETLPLLIRVDAMRAVALIQPEALPPESVPLALQLVRREPERFAGHGGDYWFFDLEQAFKHDRDLHQQFYQALLKHPIPGIRDNAVFNIQNMGETHRPSRQWATHALLEQLDVETEPHVAIKIVQRLGELGQTAQLALPRLNELAQDSTSDTGFEAVLALTKLRQQTAFPLLIQAMSTGDLLRLGKIARALQGYESLPPELTLPVLDALRRIREGQVHIDPELAEAPHFFGEPRDDIWSCYLRVIKHLTADRDRVLDEVIQALCQVPNWQVVPVAAQYIAEHDHSAQALPYLLEALNAVQDNDPDSYNAILKAIATIREPAVLSFLIRHWPPPLHEHHRDRVTMNFAETVTALSGSASDLANIRQDSMNELEKFGLDVLRWESTGKNPDGLDTLIERVEHAEQWQWLMLKDLLAHVEPHSSAAERISPLLKKYATDHQFGRGWHNLEAASAYLNLTGDQTFFDGATAKFSDWHALYSKFGIESLIRMNAGISLLRPVLERIAHSEKWQSGYYGPDSVHEDEELQQWAEDQLKQLQMP